MSVFLTSKLTRPPCPINQATGTVNLDGDVSLNGSLGQSPPATDKVPTPTQGVAVDRRQSAGAPEAFVFTSTQVHRSVHPYANTITPTCQICYLLPSDLSTFIRPPTELWYY